MQERKGVIEMTTLTEIKEPVTTYEPTVQDKIRRILYRLDRGEELIQDALKEYKQDKFCVQVYLLTNLG